MAEQPTPGPRARVPHAPGRRRDPATDHLRDDPRGERSAEDHLHPVLQGEGPTGGQRASLGLRERMASRAQQITHG